MTKVTNGIPFQPVLWQELEVWRKGTMVHVPWERLLQVQLIHQGLILWYKLEPKWEGGSSVVVHRASWLCACLSVCLFIYLSIMCLSKGKIVLVQGNARRIIVQCSGPVPIREVSAGFAFGAC